MAWTTEQNNRLIKEKEILKKYFPNFEFKYYGTILCLEGWMYTNKKTGYHIRLYVPPDVPNSVPEVVIISPFPVNDYFGKSLVSYGTSSTMHLLAPRDNCPKICTYKATYWNPNRTFYNVLIKVRLWLEALDGHKTTGKPLDTYLPHQV
ncbi:MAG: hypothetical protein IPP32_03220 [Bacteroidetes bacterium]|nr:hypothetical protein [Bacteroidota bacterium]